MEIGTNVTKHTENPEFHTIVGVPRGSRRLQETPGGSQRRLEAPEGSQQAPGNSHEAPGGTCRLPKSPGGSGRPWRPQKSPRRLQEALRRLQEAPAIPQKFQRESTRLPRGPRRFQGAPGDPWRPQEAPRTACIVGVPRAAILI